MMRRDLIGHLIRAGCRLERESDRHSWWHNLERDRRSAVPRHSEIAGPLVQKICRDLHIEPPHP